MSTNSARPASIGNRLDARDVRYMLVVGSVALLGSLAAVFFFKAQAFVDASGDPYHYGEIARGFVDHGFTKLTRRAATLYPELIAVIYRLGGDNLAVVLLQCLFHAGTCLLAYLLGRGLCNA